MIVLSIACKQKTDGTEVRYKPGVIVAMFLGAGAYVIRRLRDYVTTYPLARASTDSFMIHCAQLKRTLSINNQLSTAHAYKVRLGSIGRNFLALQNCLTDLTKPLNGDNNISAIYSIIELR